MVWYGTSGCFIIIIITLLYNTVVTILVETVNAKRGSDTHTRTDRTTATAHTRRRADGQRRSAAIRTIQAAPRHTRVFDAERYHAVWYRTRHLCAT